MTIGEYIKRKNPYQYNRLRKICKQKEKKKEIELGDSIVNLMKHDAYKRVGRRIKQIKWG